MPLPYLSSAPGGVDVAVHAQPRASRSKLVGEHDGRLKVQLAAPPVDGEANAALVELFAELFGVPKRQVEVVSGQTGRRKVVRVAGVTVETAERAIAEALQ
jgi:uncharacterized protein (TIGR00251 family)